VHVESIIINEFMFDFMFICQAYGALLTQKLKHKLELININELSFSFTSGAVHVLVWTCPEQKAEMISLISRLFDEFMFEVRRWTDYFF